MISNTPCTPFLDDYEEPYFVGQESWEAFLKSETENLSSRAPPAPGVSEMVFEKPEECNERMEEDCVPYDEELYFRNFVDEFDLSKMRRPESFRLHVDYDNNFADTQGSECSRRDTEVDQEEAGSISTRDSLFGEFNNFENDGLSFATDDNVFSDTVSDLDAELTNKIVNALRGRSDEEKAYIEKIFPMLLNSVKEIFEKSQLPLNDNIVAAIVKELLTSKYNMMKAEREVLNRLTQEEIEEVAYDRPESMITEEELNVSNRKEKRAVKGNRNGSSMNHINENYASNIFQFAKRNYPDDKELQRLANGRNVSALNFRKIVSAKLTDGIMARKAKTRLAESGKELVQNIEYWMRDGYFDQCTDREKYIYHKEKALRDLALSGNY